MSGSPCILWITVFVARMLCTTPSIFPSVLCTSSPSTTARCRKISAPEMRFCMMFFAASETARPPTPPMASIAPRFRLASWDQTRAVPAYERTERTLSTNRMISASLEARNSGSFLKPPFIASRWSPRMNLATGPISPSLTLMSVGSLIFRRYAKPSQVAKARRMRLVSMKNASSISVAWRSPSPLASTNARTFGTWKVAISGSAAMALLNTRKRMLACVMLANGEPSLFTIATRQSETLSARSSLQTTSTTALEELSKIFQA
mmetsp:Transcript_30439/g.90355  ORF Transcript_30439/g.90355 Transcript_30439/m.90355 type:complete len:263 (+) Transcript_30439:578-1366(+)